MIKSNWRFEIFVIFFGAKIEDENVLDISAEARRLSISRQFPLCAETRQSIFCVKINRTNVRNSLSVREKRMKKKTHFRSSLLFVMTLFTKVNNFQVVLTCTMHVLGISFKQKFTSWIAGCCWCSQANGEKIWMFWLICNIFCYGKSSLQFFHEIEL